MTSRNFNPMIATCGKVTVAEVEQLVDVGELDPDQIHTPGIYVDRIIQGTDYEKRIEFRTVSGAAASKKDSPIRELMARRAAQGIARRLLRQSRHRHTHARRQFIPSASMSRCNPKTDCWASARSRLKTGSTPT